MGTHVDTFHGGEAEAQCISMMAKVFKHEGDNPFLAKLVEKYTNLLRVYILACKKYTYLLHTKAVQGTRTR